MAGCDRKSIRSSEDRSNEYVALGHPIMFREIDSASATVSQIEVHSPDQSNNYPIISLLLRLVSICVRLVEARNLH